MIFFLPVTHVQAENHNVSAYIVGIVIGIAALAMTVTSPFIGYFVSIVAVSNRV